MSKSPFLSSMEEYMVVRRYSKRTIKGYLYWIRSYILYHKKVHPKELHAKEVEGFLTYLAVKRQVSTSTQRIALNALAFLYNKFLEQPLGNLSEFNRVKRQPKLPTVLTECEVISLLQHLDAAYKLPVGLLYGSGLRLMECVRLRVNDIDLGLKQVRIWNGKGAKHRLSTLAIELAPAIKHQIQKVEHYLEDDLKNESYRGVCLPDALDRKYKNANKYLGSQFSCIFPLSKVTDPTH